MSRRAASPATSTPNSTPARQGDREQTADDASLDTLRIDKWLWSARFFKTRSSAAQAVSGGHVRIDDQRIKPSRRLRRGESLRVRRGMQEWEVEVIGLCARRCGAPLAQGLYRETEGSIERRTNENARQEQAAARRAVRNDRHFRRERRERRAFARRELPEDEASTAPNPASPVASPTSQAPLESATSPRGKGSSESPGGR